MEFFLSIFFGTFVLEDAALAAAFVLIAKGKLSLLAAFAACFLGISIGDMGLYLLGRAAARFPAVRNLKLLKKLSDTKRQPRAKNLIPALIITSRAIPGTRAVTYFTAGLLRYSALRFLLLTVVSVGAWVLLVLSGGVAIGHLDRGNLILIALGFFIALVTFRAIAASLGDVWNRRAFLHSWRRWAHFEFWPAWLFYLPIIPYYIFRSLRGGSFLLPFYANPQILNGGLIGESKLDFLSYLKVSDPTTLPSAVLPPGIDPLAAENLIREQNLTYPFVLKPDVGQRGYGVRVIRNAEELAAYLGQAPFTLIAQCRSVFNQEAGIFYVRRPSEPHGKIFSITRKTFPCLVGNGRRSLGELILRDSRARIIAPVYFSRHRARLDDLVPEGAPFLLTECGNHCQGAVFENGANLNGPGLLARIEEISRGIPDFYFGRFDVRFQDDDSLRAGQKFEIIEINGAGSEATHIWDRNTRLWDAYATLFAQWKILFAIGAEIKREGRPVSNIRLKEFFRECLRVNRRDDPLTVSS